MEKMFTNKERRYIENLMKSSKETDPVLWPSWGAWVSFGLGGFLIASACFITASNLSIETIGSVLMPGIFAGAVLVVGGYWTQYKSKKSEGDKILAGILRKLMK
ncbi:MAG: hypothetical protein WD071_06485 [Pseudohongiella sp.]|uniref:hypothetical protein n=1 Tax=Pseudohongiella sp. TaxID=1979412 RepID=UPI0034A047E0